MKGKSTPPEITPPHQTTETLPWEALYAAHEEGGRYGDWEWEEETRRFNSFYGDYPNPIDPPITLDLLVSTAAALPPMFGVEKLVETDQGPKRATAVAAEEAYGLLSDCVRLMERAAFKKEKLAKLKASYDSQTMRHQEKGRIKLYEGLRRITDRSHRQDAQARFRGFLEVFYGEVLYNQEEAVVEPWMPGGLDVERGDFKIWAQRVYAFYQERGFWEEEVVFYAEKFKKLEERGFLKKSTYRSLSRTKTKKGKPSVAVSKHT
jgi:hypothetical protein